MKKTISNERGVVLVYVLIILLLTAILSVTLIRLSFARAMVVVKQRNSLQERAAAEAAYSRAANCLTLIANQSTAQPLQCQVPTGSQCAICNVGDCSQIFSSISLGTDPQSQDNYALSFSFNSATPPCQLQVDVTTMTH